MKEKILKLLAEKKEMYLTELPLFLPEIKGEFAIYMSVKEGINPNILWLAGVSQEFIKIFNELLTEEKVIDWKPQDISSLLFESKPIYAGIPVCTKKSAKQKRECWLPISIYYKK